MGWIVYRESVRQELGLSGAGYRSEWFGWNYDPSNYPYITDYEHSFTVWRKPMQDGTSWSPSSNIADAYEVVEEMLRKGYPARLETPTGERDSYVCHLVPRDTSNHYVEAETLPLAICHAALNVVDSLQGA